jgi:transcription elongation factor Elf1
MSNLNTAVRKVKVDNDNGKHILKCPVCNRPLIVDDGEKWKLKTRIVIFLKDKTLAKCKFCRNDIEVPVKFEINTVSSGKLAIDPDNPENR